MACDIFQSVIAAVVALVGCGGDDGNGGATDPPPPPPPGPSLSSVSCTLDAIADVEYEGSTRPAVAFAWSGHGVMSDATETVLDSAVVTVGGVRVQKFTGGTSGSGTLGSGDTEDGNNTLSITCYRETRAGSDFEEFGIFKLVTTTFNAIHFFSQEPNLTGTTVTVQQGSDTRSVTLTDGQGSLTIRAGTNNIQIQDTDSGQLHYLEEVGAAPGEHLVFDSLAHAVEVTGDTDYRIVSVDDEQFLKDMAQQWNTTGTARAPVPGALKIVLYEGNPTCNPDWHPEYDQYDDCGDAQTWFPGKPMAAEEIARFYTFIEDTQAILDDPRFSAVEEELVHPVHLSSGVYQGSCVLGVRFDPRWLRTGCGRWSSSRASSIRSCPCLFRERFGNRLTYWLSASDGHA